MNHRLTIHGTPFVVVEADLYVFSLIVDCQCPGGRLILEQSEEVKRLRHGLNTYSLFSPKGGWVLASPSRERAMEVIQDALAPGALLACANVDRQWVFAHRRMPEATQKLARIACSLIPHSDTMRQGRRKEVEQALSQLCLEFATLANISLAALAPEDVIWDVTPGSVIIPAAAASKGVSVRELADVDALDVIHDLLFPALTYWWDSMFLGWWKGFW